MILFLISDLWPQFKPYPCNIKITTELNRILWSFIIFHFNDHDQGTNYTGNL